MNDVPELPVLHPLRRPVPEGGLEAAVAAGRRRLWVRGTTALTSAAVVLTAFTLFQPAESSPDSLIANDPTQTASPAANPSGSPNPEPTPTPRMPGSEPSASPHPSTGAAASAEPQSPDPEAVDGSASQEQPGPASLERPGFREQTDEDAPRPAVCRSAPGVASSCAYTDDSGAILRRGSETRAVIGECTSQDTLGPTRYGFDTGQETELVVTLQGREVFRFSSTVSYLDGAHERVLESGKCIQWTNAWRGTTTAGHPVPSGTYQVTLTLTVDWTRTAGAPPPEPSSEPYGGNSHQYDVTVVD